MDLYTEHEEERIHEKQKDHLGPSALLSLQDEHLVQAADNYKSLLNHAGWKQLENTLIARIRQLQEAMWAAKSKEDFDRMKQAMFNINEIFGTIKSTIHEGERIRQEMSEIDTTDNNPLAR